MVASGESGFPASRGRAFTANDFRVPAHYLPLLIGDEAAAAMGQTSSAGHVLASTVFLNLCLEHMRRTGDESCGVAPHPVARGTFGLLLAAAAQGDTFAEALRRFADAAPMLRPDLVVRFSRSRRGLELSIASHGPPDPRRDLLVEVFALTAHCGFRWLTGRRLTPAFLRVQPATPPMGPTLLRPVVSPTAVRRGSGVTVGYALADARAALRPVKYQHWAAHELGEFNALLEEAAAGISSAAPVAQPGVVDQVRGAIGGGGWDEPTVARALGMSAATLRRRLSDAGASFRELCSDVRRQEAVQLLATDRDLEDVAAELGFSDARSLRRACRTWFGMAPAEYRNARRQ